MTSDARTPSDSTSAQDSIAMSGEEEAQYLQQGGEPAEPADEGIGAVTDNEDRSPDTDN